MSGRKKDLLGLSVVFAFIIFKFHRGAPIECINLEKMSVWDTLDYIFPPRSEYVIATDLGNGYRGFYSGVKISFRNFVLISILSTVTLHYNRNHAFHNFWWSTWW